MIEFKTHPDWGYRPRTIENCSADATIAFAVFPNTAGEILTKNSVKQQRKLFFFVDLGNPKHGWNDLGGTRDRFIDSFESGKIKTLNIAGNGLYTLRGYFTQNECDEIVYDFLSSIKEINELELIRSGGQSGFDESGLKAAVKLGIPALCLAPSNWMFRNENGVDIKDEKAFKARFSDPT